MSLKMCVRNLTILIIFCFSTDVLGKSIQISDKLDVENIPHQLSPLKNENNFQIKVVRTEDALTSPSEQVSISCGLAGCNTTNLTNSVETEVVVHVKTNVNIDKNKDHKDVEHVSEVPVVVGYKGLRTAQTLNEKALDNYPSVVTNENDVTGYSKNNYHSLLTTNTEFPYFMEKRGMQGFLPSSPYNAYPEYLGNERSGLPESNIDLTARFSKGTPNDYYDSLGPKSLDFTTSSYLLNPSIPRRMFNYRNNVGYLPMPNFGHTYNRQYFSEEPPFYSRSFSKTKIFNPVEFRNIQRNIWRPTLRNGETNKYAFANDGGSIVKYHPHDYITSLTNRPSPNQPNHQSRGCLCREQPPIDSLGSNSDGAESVNHHIAILGKDPGTSINDKLGPLN